MREAAASGAPPTLQRVRLGDCPPQPWRNGGGLTRELLAWATAAHDTAAGPGTTPPGWTVRVSVAEITRDGPFSPYPGVDRAFAVLEGRGVVLAWPQGDTVCRPGDEALRFDGAQAPGCRLVDGGFAHALRQAAATVGATVPGVHAAQGLFTLVNRHHRALHPNTNLRVGDNDGDLDDAVAVRVQPRHLEVDPHQVVLVRRQRGLGGDHDRGGGGGGKIGRVGHRIGGCRMAGEVIVSGLH